MLIRVDPVWVGWIGRIHGHIGKGCTAVGRKNHPTAVRNSTGLAVLVGAQHVHEIGSARRTYHQVVIPTLPGAHVVCAVPGIGWIVAGKLRKGRRTVRDIIGPEEGGLVGAIVTFVYIHPRSAIRSFVDGKFGTRDSAR